MKILFSLKPLTYNLKPTRRGQVLVEAMVALSALTLGYLAILALLNQSLGTSATVSDRNIATYLSAEGIEIVRNLSDATIKNGAFAQNFMDGNNRQFLVSWEDQLGNPNPGRLALNLGDVEPLRFDSQKGYNYTAGEPTRFTRIAYITVFPSVANPTYIKVRSVVSWSGKGGLSDSVTTEDFFFNWK